MYTVGKLSKEFKISRSTLLYYDKIGLLKLSERSESNYRLYSHSDVERLRIIMHHKKAGIPLDDISKLFDLEVNDVTIILNNRLNKIQEDIKLLKMQESMILSVLIDQIKSDNSALYDRNSWTSLLLKLGYSHDEMLEWHRNFDLESKDDHRKFLIALGLNEEEIKKLIKML
ncbi:MerR family transcriptional regulator [Helicovermis profundi]|uniref:MerR family transcriptional regulator n=1 Tax=Helicovermis profundi TaxID=3065157 RepID=A0AAU9E9E2_9FIRM|nr:MerR family transcriptional regulator [Clostridia bacterium S502]